MLASKKLPEILRSVLSDGVEGALIMTLEGSILSSDFISYSDISSTINETSLGAISSAIWNNYVQGKLRSK